MIWWIQTPSTTSSKLNQLRNINTVRWAYRTFTTKPEEIYNRKPKVAATETETLITRIPNIDKLLQQAYVMERLKSSLKRLCMVDTGIWSNNEQTALPDRTRHSGSRKPSVNQNVQLSWALLPNYTLLMNLTFYSNIQVLPNNVCKVSFFLRQLFLSNLGLKIFYCWYVFPNIVMFCVVWISNIHQHFNFTLQIHKTRIHNTRTSKVNTLVSLQNERRLCW